MNDRWRLSDPHVLERMPDDGGSHAPPRQPADRAVPAVIIGMIAAVDADGTPVVSWRSATGELVKSALSQVAVSTDHIGRRCTLAFEAGMQDRPVILGLLQEVPASPDNYRVIHAEGALILQCGAARIELRQDGHIIVQGMQIDNQSYGPYRIRGASIKLN